MNWKERQRRRLEAENPPAAAASKPKGEKPVAAAEKPSKSKAKAEGD